MNDSTRPSSTIDMKDRLTRLFAGLADATTVSPAARLGDRSIECDRVAIGRRPSRLVLTAATAGVVLVGAMTVVAVSRSSDGSPVQDSTAPSLAPDPYAPGTVIPSGVTMFPVLEETDVPDVGTAQAPTSAFIGYYSSGERFVGTTWRGMVGREVDGDLTDLVLIAASTLTDAEQLPDLQPGRLLDVRERDFGSGVELSAVIDGFSVILQGTDLDQLYAVLDLVRPQLNGGDLAGYTLAGPLPDGFTEVAPAFQFGPGLGSYPNLYVRNGVVTVSVVPAPLLPALAQGFDSLERISTAIGEGYLYTQPDGGYLYAGISLPEGPTVLFTGFSVTRAELLHAIDATTFTDQATWMARYGAHLPVVLSLIETAPANTELGVEVPDGTTPVGTGVDAPPDTDPPRIVAGTVAGETTPATPQP